MQRLQYSKLECIYVKKNTVTHPRVGRGYVHGVANLVLLRHGQSAWNLENRFTGWWDVGLTPQGEQEALQAGELIVEAGLRPDQVHTSVLSRAVHTAHLAMEASGRLWIPLHKHWRLNERHYGELTGMDKAEARERFGDELFKAWRRSYSTPPPPMPDGHPYSVREDPRYRWMAPGAHPASECLADVVARMLPYWYDAIAPELLAGQDVLVVAHGNSLRALTKHLEGLSEQEVTDLDIPTGVPIWYRLGPAFEVVSKQALGDPEVIAAATEAVRRQGVRGT